MRRSDSLGHRLETAGKFFATDAGITEGRGQTALGWVPPRFDIIFTFCLDAGEEEEEESVDWS